MNPLFRQIRHDPMLWLLAVVPLVLVVEKLEPQAHSALFVLSVLAIVGVVLFLRFTTVGVAVRAVGENVERASLLGISVEMSLLWVG